MFSRNPVLRLFVMLSLLLGAMFTEAAPVAAETGPCDANPASITNRWAGMDREGVSWSAHGVRAVINPASATFMPCSGLDGTALSHDAVLAWVGLTGDSFDEIIQIGIVRCNEFATAACAGQGARYFWANGGCNGDEPKLEDIGPASWDPIEYRIERAIVSGAPRYNFYIGSSLKKYIWESDSRVSCWLGDSNDADWLGETWDGGDGYADPNDKLNFTEARYQSTTGGVWASPNWDYTPGVLCDPGADNSDQLDHKCDVVGSNKFDIWSEAW